MPTVYVNDKPVEIGTGRLNCVQAADKAGVFIPHYCWHEALTVVAVCRMCLVEVGELKPDGKVSMQPKVVPGCQTPVKDGTVIVTGEYDKRDTARRRSPTTRLQARRAGQEGPGGHARRAARSTTRSTARCATRPASASSRTTATSTAGPSRAWWTPRTSRRTSRNCRARSRSSPTAASCVRGASASPARSPARPNCQSSTAGTTPRSTCSPAGRWRTSWPATWWTSARSGRSGSKDFLYKQRVWYLKSADRSARVQHRVQHPRRREQGHRLPPPAAGEPGGPGLLHVRRGAVRLPLRQLGRPVRAGRRCRRTARSSRRRGPQLLAADGEDFAAAAAAPAACTAVLSPFLTVEEAFLLAPCFKGLSPGVRLVLGPVPVVGRGRHVPEGRAGQPGRADEVHDPRREVPEPPGRRGGAEALPGRSGAVRGGRRCGQVGQGVGRAADGGYPSPETVPGVGCRRWNGVALLATQDLFARR